MADMHNTFAPLIDVDNPFEANEETATETMQWEAEVPNNELVGPEHWLQNQWTPDAAQLDAQYLESCLHRFLQQPQDVSSILGLDHGHSRLIRSDGCQTGTSPPSVYKATNTSGRIQWASIVEELLSFREVIQSNETIYLIVDSRSPKDVGHWPQFAAWWRSRRKLVSPDAEKCDVVWYHAHTHSGLQLVPYIWAGTFVLAVARWLYPRVHFALVDNDCVPTSLFSINELLHLA